MLQESKFIRDRRDKYLTMNEFCAIFYILCAIQRVDKN